MNKETKPITILMAEDDPDDFLLAREALTEARLANELHIVKDGQELMDYLLKNGKYIDETQCPRPGIILLDLNMPRKDGREALAEIKSHPDLRSIPVVVLTTSKSDEDIFQTYDLGVSGYVTKPVTFDGLVEVMKSIGEYWFHIVKLPHGDTGDLIFD
jgi:CheY-like chemotaxis protein